MAALALLCPAPGHGQVAAPQTPQATPAPTEVTGTVAVWRTDIGVVLDKNAAKPVQFTFGTKVECVGPEGKPLALDAIHAGDPVTVHFIREGERMIANRVTAERKPAPAPEPAITGAGSPTAATSPNGAKADAGLEAKSIESIRASIEKEARQMSGRGR
jgi:hypothetical protein